MSDQDFDIGKYIIPKSDQINAEDFTKGPQIVTIRRVRDRGVKDQPVEIFLDEFDRPWRPCKTTMRVLVYGWGAKVSQWVGRQVRLYLEPTVTWGGAEVGGIRINGMSDLPEEHAQGFVLATAKSNKARAKQEVRHLKRRVPDEARTGGASDLRERPRLTIEELRTKGDLVAQQGSTTLQGWWTGLEKEQRKALAEDLPAWKTTAVEADRKGAPTESDPFTVPGDDVRLDQDGELDDGTGDLIEDDEIARRTAEAEAAIQERDRAQAEG